MIILIGLALVIVIGFLLNKYTCHEELAWALEILGAVLLAIALICLPCILAMVHGEIQEYHATKYTIEQARQDGISELERAALTQKIIDTNAWLANCQYWNKTIVGIYVPDEVEKLKYLK